MLKTFKNQINFTSIIALNSAYVFFHHLLLALFWLLFVAVNEQGQKNEMSAGQSNYGRVVDLMQLRKRNKILKVRYLIKDTNCL